MGAPVMEPAANRWERTLKLIVHPWYVQGP
jgi:hypothetical protein